MNNVTVKFTKLYRLREDLSQEEKVICLAAGIVPGEILWCLNNRPSSLGGYIGNFARTYKQAYGYSPGAVEFKNMPMRYFEQVF